MRVPFNDLKAQHALLKDELCRAIGMVIDTGAFSGGPFVEAFERDFASYCGSKHAIGVASGTDALWLTLSAMGVGPGDEVITVPMSFIATAEAISRAGAKPVFVDIDPQTYTMDPAALAGALSRKTKAIIPVQLFGQSADMGPILEFAAKHGLPVIEDAAQSHGAEYAGLKVGSLGHAGCFSFYPGKNLGALGEGGAVLTNDDTLAEKIRVLRNHGQLRKHHHSMVGWNSRMDGIQGAVLRIKLRHLDKENEIRRNHALRYDHAFAGLEEMVTPARGDNRTHVFHIYAIQVRDRPAMVKFLGDSGIGVAVHYPVPIHLQPAFAALGHKKGDFPVSESCADSFISLPMFSGLTPGQIERVVEVVTEALPARLIA